MRVRTLEIPLDDRLQASAKSIELAMQSSRTSSVRQSMCGVSIACIQLLQSPSARDPSACSPAASSSRGRLVHLAVRRLQSRNHAHPSLDADRHPETSHLIRHLPQHSLPRVLPSSRLPTLRFSRIVAHTRFLRAHCCAVSPRTWHAGETLVLGTDAWRALADRLAPNQSWSVISRRNAGAQTHREMCRCGLCQTRTHLCFALDQRHQTKGCFSRSMSTQFVMAGTKWKCRLDVLIGLLFCTKSRGEGLWPRKLP